MKIRILLLVLLMVLAMVVIAAIRIKSNRPPETAVIKAGKLLAEAELEKASEFAPKPFQEARMYYDSAMINWRIQNKRFILVRDYSEVTELVQKSAERSEIAIIESKKIISTTGNLLKINIDFIGRKIHGFEEQFKNFPVSRKHRSELTQCKLMYSESLQAYISNNYSICKSKLDSVEIVIDDFITYYCEKLEDYFEDYPEWNEMVIQTISYSKKSQATVIIVDKFNRELFIYKSGKPVKQYSIELGANWIGDKMHQGDKSTPEGFYNILEKKQNGQTKYHKALLLNYPNAEDKKRFSANIRNGIIRHDSQIGNLIEIHGNGGKRTDWTDGCIALADSDMDDIFEFCTVGTKVTIVGSRKPLNDISYIFK
jgi:murein L,D-transpeptidase YafK